MDHLNIAFLLITKYCHSLLSFQNLRNVLKNRSFEQCLLPKDTQRRFSVHEMPICYRRHHVDAILTLERRCVFSWLQFIGNNIKVFKNQKVKITYILCGIFIKTFHFMKMLGPVQSWKFSIPIIHIEIFVLVGFSFVTNNF